MGYALLHSQTAKKRSQIPQESLTETEQAVNILLDKKELKINNQEFYNIIVSFMKNKINWYGRLSDFHWSLKINNPFNETKFLKALENIKDQLQFKNISYIFNPYPETDLHIDIKKKVGI